MVMDNGHGAVRVRAQFSNITVYGATNYTILDVKYVLDFFPILKWTKNLGSGLTYAIFFCIRKNVFLMMIFLFKFVETK